MRNYPTLSFIQVWLVSFAVLSSVVSCRNGKDPAASRGNLVVVGIEDETALLPDATNADFLFFSRLVAKNARGELEPCLASRWEDSPDGRTRTWHLRSDAYWHDGRRVTAHDVKFTLDLLSHPDVAEYSSYGEVTVVDDFTVQISATRHNYGNDIVIYPRHLLESLEKARFWQWDFWMKPVGSGPYRFVKYVPNHFMELEANPDYFLGRPRIEKVQLKFVGRAGLAEALSGNIDILYPSDPADWPLLDRTGLFRIHYGVHPPAMVGLYLNHHHPLFSDSRVRRAIAHALDRPTLLETLGLPRELPLADVFFTKDQLHRKEVPPPLAYDTARANLLLDEAGWIDRDTDGIREKDGVEARFSLLPRPPGGREVLIQEYLRRVGLKAEIEPVERSVAWDRVGAGDFEAAVHVVQPNVLWHARFFGEDSAVGYSNEKVARLLARARVTARSERLDEIYLELQGEFLRDVPLILLEPASQSFFIHRRIRGLGSSEWTVDPMKQLEDLWVANGSR
jgi:peptide/nickel transport system substrate-binding protein